MIKSFATLITFLLLNLFALLSFAEQQPTPNFKPSVARQWNQMALVCVRGDYARPTVIVRTLFHLSAVMYDSWSLYDANKKSYLVNHKRSATDIEKARAETLSYASYELLKVRFAKSPKAAITLGKARDLMIQLGYNPDLKRDENFYESSDANPAQDGMFIAHQYLQSTVNDGSRESQDYETPREDYAPLNPPMIVKLPKTLKIIDVNFWQPMSLDFNVDQAGNPIPVNTVPPLTLHWGRLPPFALTAADRSPTKRGVYLDPGAPPRFGGAGHNAFVKSMVEVIEFSSWLDPKDSARLDISPNSLGRSSLGTNENRGYKNNPVTGTIYPQQSVKRGDYARVLAEFWADGPQSETPPGHWNTMANDVVAQPTFKRQWMGKGGELSPLEWDVKMYLTLNGGLYDASITAWGLKGYYQGSRPISAVRFMAGNGQSSNPELPGYSVIGLPLKPGLIELVTSKLTQPGEKFAHLIGYEGQVAIRCWNGAPKDPKTEAGGVSWMLGIEWLPYQKPTFVTPPFPGYISGHSTFSRAAAEVLTGITGSPYFPSGLGQYSAKANSFLTFEAGPSEAVNLQWASYYDAADQSGISRIFGGIHGNIDDFPGRKIGSVIGKKAVGRSNAIFTGK